MRKQKLDPTMLEISSFEPQPQAAPFTVQAMTGQTFPCNTCDGHCHWTV